MLPYQQNVIEQLLQWVPIKNCRILEIGGSPNWEVASYLIKKGAKSVTSINYREDLKDIKISENIEFKNVDARQMSKYLEGSYDLIFGIAVLEHLPNLDIVLEESTRLLKEGGSIMLHGAAFWSSKWGHHVFVHIDGEHYEFNGRNNPIDDWGHLYLNFKEMKEFLEDEKGLPRSHATAICEYIYRDGILNRFHYEDIITSYSRAKHNIEHIISKTNGKITESVRQSILDKFPSVSSSIYRDFDTFELIILSKPMS